MNYFKNGDAHLKNFGILYSSDFRKFFAPAYDVVNIVYFHKDRPTLSMFLKKFGLGKKSIKFGIQTVI